MLKSAEDMKAVMRHHIKEEERAYGTGTDQLSDVKSYPVCSSTPNSQSEQVALAGESKPPTPDQLKGGTNA